MTLPYADVAALISFHQTAVFALIEANRHGWQVVFLFTARGGAKLRIVYADGVPAAGCH